METKARIAEALTSVRRLEAVMQDLTASEIEEALRLEESTERRRSIITRLQRRARVLAVQSVNRRAEVL